MGINNDISDLFFNHDLSSAVTTDEKGDFAGYEENVLEDEASEFLLCLQRLGVDTPTVAELIADFRSRV